MRSNFNIDKDAAAAMPKILEDGIKSDEKNSGKFNDTRSLKLESVSQLQKLDSGEDNDNDKSSNDTNNFENIKAFYTYQNSLALQDDVHVLLVSSLGRSGSSFLGGIIHSHPQVFYIFEPFHPYQQWNLLNKTSAVKSLKQMFSCKMESPIVSALATRLEILKFTALSSCKKRRQKCYNKYIINGFCSIDKIHLIKTIRTRISWLYELLNDKSLNLKILHLVRDPRGSILSAWNEGWKIDQTHCNLISEDINEGKKIKLLYPDK